MFTIKKKKILSLFMQFNSRLNYWIIIISHNQTWTTMSTVTTWSRNTKNIVFTHYSGTKFLLALVQRLFHRSPLSSLCWAGHQLDGRGSSAAAAHKMAAFTWENDCWQKINKSLLSSSESLTCLKVPFVQHICPTAQSGIIRTEESIMVHPSA